jgi:hypothetical protein
MVCVVPKKSRSALHTAVTALLRNAVAALFGTTRMCTTWILVILLFKTVEVKNVKTLLSYFPKLYCYIPNLGWYRSLNLIIIRSIFLGIRLNLHGLSVDLSQDSADFPKNSTDFTRIRSIFVRIRPIFLRFLPIFLRILPILLEFGRFLSRFGR